jgi:tetratricopeptide (TPR) repeat protein
MSNPTKSTANNDRAAEIRAMVDEDFDRISTTDDPYIILNLRPDADIADVRARYEQYEKFYRVDNFHRFADSNLTRRALDIRRALGRAMVSINSSQDLGAGEDGESADAQAPILPQVDSDCAALGDIYFRDGLTYLKLRDLNAAEDCLQRAVDYDPSRGIILAYLSYARFKLRNNDPLVVDECGRQLARAARMEPDNAEVYVLMARYALNIEEKSLVEHAIAKVEERRHDHPKLAKLKRRFARLD